eukprot:360155-Chlamydomonas_euryale.AAC.1
MGIRLAPQVPMWVYVDLNPHTKSPNERGSTVADCGKAWCGKFSHMLGLVPLPIAMHLCFKSTILLLALPSSASRPSGHDGFEVPCASPHREGHIWRPRAPFPDRPPPAQQERRAGRSLDMDKL